MDGIGDLAFLFFLLVMGWALHICKKWGEGWKDEKKLSLKEYFGKNLPASIASILAPCLVFVIMAYGGELQEAPIGWAGWGCASLGWLGNSAADILGKRAEAFKSKASG